MTRDILGTLSLLFAVSCVPPAASPPSLSAHSTFADSGAFVIHIGRDTLKYERFVIHGNHLHSEAVRRGAGIEYQIVDEILNDDGSVRRADMRVLPWPRAPEALPVYTSTVTIAGDSSIVVQGDRENTARLSFPGVSDLYNGVGINPIAAVAFSGFPLIAPAKLGDSMIAGQVQTVFGRRPLVVQRVAPHLIMLRSTFIGQMSLRVDDQARLLSLDGTGGSLPFQAEQLGWIDLDSAGRVLAEMNRRATVGNILSPRDSVVAKIGGATLTVDYGRPSRRGRLIFGSVVPWNQVWRTGANLATHFTTDRALQFGSVIVPAGKYTLFTIPSQTHWILIISSETGEWGTDYDLNQDFARIPMQARTLDLHVEQFTIDILLTDGQPTLRFTWDTIQAFIPFQVK